MTTLESLIERRTRELETLRERLDSELSDVLSKLRKGQNPQTLQLAMIAPGTTSDQLMQVYASLLDLQRCDRTKHEDAHALVEQAQ